MTYGVDWVCECGWANLDVRKHCRKCGVPRSLSEVPALEALAGRQVAVTEEMVGKGIEGWHRSLIDAPDEDVDARRDWCIRATLEAALTVAPPAPQAAEEPAIGALQSDEWEYTTVPTPSASGKVEAEVVERYDVTDASGMAPAPLGKWVRFTSHRSTVAAMQAEIERLTRTWEHQWLQERDLKLAAEAELARLWEGLEPFSELADEGSDDLADDEGVVVKIGKRVTDLTLTLGDLRRARALFKGETEQEGGRDE